MSEISTSQTALPTLREVCRDYLLFIRRPVLPNRRLGFGWFGLEATAGLLLLDIAAMAIILCVVGLYVLNGGQIPKNALDGKHMTGTLFLLMVFIGPAVEESVFRGWLTGTPRVIGIYGTLIMIVTALLAGGRPDAYSLLFLLTVLLAGVASSLLWLPGNVPVEQAKTAFPWLFWGSSVAFALVHLTNFTAAHKAALAVWVVPQLISGTIFAYARVRIGMWSNLMLHTTHNGLTFVIAMMIGEMGR